MKKVYIFNVSKSEYSKVQIQAHSDEEAEDRLKEVLEDENVDWHGKPEYSWDLADIEGEDMFDPEDDSDLIDGEFGLEDEDE